MYLSFYVGVLCFVCFVIHCFEPFLDEEERADCASIVFLMSCECYVGVLWFFLAVPWDGLQYVVVEFPDHTHLLFESCKLR